LKNLDAKVNINRAWEIIRENPWFNEGCLKSLDQRKQAKLQ
jgi:hypothetical protein